MFVENKTTPYYLYKKGIRPEEVYVCQGASTVPATDAATLNMIRETSGDSMRQPPLLTRILQEGGTLYEK